jgi:hypothetical protein
MQASIGGLIGETLRLLRSGRVGAGYWLLLLVIAGSTNFIDFRAATGTRDPAMLAVGLLLRVVGVIWLSAAILRRLLDAPSPWGVNAALARFFGVQLVFFAVSALLGAPLGRALAGSEPAMRTAALVATSLVAMLLLTPLRPWAAGAAVGDRRMTFAASLRSMRGLVLPLGGAMLLLVGPFSVLHGLLTALAVQAGNAGDPARRDLLAAVDGTVSAPLLMLVLAFSAVAYRHVAGRGPLRETPALA